MESIIGKYYWSISLDDIKTHCVPLTVNYTSSDKPLEVPTPPPEWSTAVIRDQVRDHNVQGTQSPLALPPPTWGA